ncbi:MAG TPA: DEAD/DEAH box helicase family protein, partial [Pyrinomonadaceae bacterium]|nr:DEAD/DEAH box helicase family protein [Pyrinomonadaceae bacterium]
MQQHSKYLPESLPSERQGQSETPPVYAEVAVPLHVASSFIYKLPPEMRALAQAGSRLVVPLGRKRVTGFIVKLHADLAATPNLTESEIKDVDELVDLVPLLTPELLELTKWVADYYLSPWGEVIKAALPPGITPSIDDYLTITEKGRSELNNGPRDSGTRADELLRELADDIELKLSAVYTTFGKSQATRIVRELESNGLLRIVQRPAGHSVKAKLERRVRLTRKTQEDQTTGRQLTAAQIRVLDALASQPSTSFASLLTAAGVSGPTIATLERRGLVETFTEQLRRDPLEGASLPAVEDYTLTPGQNRVLAEIEQPLKDRRYSAFLLHGVTGSGKTEVYIRAMRVALALDRSAMMLVPEIALTPVFSRRLNMHFGDLVAMFHSSRSRGE